MPRLVKGAKWTYGWVVVGPTRRIVIPPEAWRAFGFQAGGEAVFLPGSRRSGGFSLSTPGLVQLCVNSAGGGLTRRDGRPCRHRSTSIPATGC